MSLSADSGLQGSPMSKEQRLAKIARIIGEIHQQMQHPGLPPMTSNQLRQRANQRRELVTGLKLQGGRVNPEYE